MSGSKDSELDTGRWQLPSFSKCQPPPPPPCLSLSLGQPYKTMYGHLLSVLSASQVRDMSQKPSFSCSLPSPSQQQALTLSLNSQLSTCNFVAYNPKLATPSFSFVSLFFTSPKKHKNKRSCIKKESLFTLHALGICRKLASELATAYYSYKAKASFGSFVSIMFPLIWIYNFNGFPWYILFDRLSS